MAAALTEYIETWRAWFLETVEERADPGEASLRAFFGILQDWLGDQEFGGCLAMQALVEFEDGTHPLHALARAHLESVQKFLAEHARRAKAAQPTALARQLLCLAQGAILLARAGNGKTAGKEARNAAKLLIADALP